ncbi:PP0621 family protein [Sedimenticola hydrogenitrophicus]|uniref:PP0621 family protein n=1 Tax=Sedimenticola hydrogenitrophicus TaxID=2967975 RepID=UPI003B58813F
MGIRLILILLTLWALYIIVRGYIRRSRKPSVKRDNKVTANMVQCKFCGTYLPEPEALQHNGEFFCSKEHLIRQESKK